MAEKAYQLDSAPSEEHEGVKLGNLRMDFETYRVSVSGKLVELTAKEFDLLRLMARRAGRITSFEELALGLFATADRSSKRHLSVLVHRLRSKLAGIQPYVIETVRGRGYGLLLAADQGSRPRHGPGL